MRRSLIFRYDEATAGCAPAGGHGIDVERLRRRVRDRRVGADRRPGAADGCGRRGLRRSPRAVSRRVRRARLRADAPRLRADARCRPCRRRDLRRSPDLRAAARRGRAPPAVDAGQGRGAGVGRALRRDRGRVLQTARAAHRPRPRHPRAGDPAPVRSVDGAGRRGRSAGGRASPLRVRDPGGAARTARGPAASARARAAGDRDDAVQRGRAAVDEPTPTSASASRREASPTFRPRSSRSPRASCAKPSATRRSTRARPG